MGQLYAKGIMLVNTQRIRNSRTLCGAMKSEEELRGDRLKVARQAAGFATATEAARSLGVPEQTYLAHENGSRGIRVDAGQKYARRFKVDFDWLMTGRGAGPMTASTSRANVTGPSVKNMSDLRSVRVVGAVQAGVWIEAVEWPLHEQYEIPLPIQASYRTLPLSAFEVVGPSMDELYPHGAVIVCVKYYDLGRDPRHGERVVAVRRRHDECEASLKEFRIDRDGMGRLWPRSTHPDFQQPLVMPTRPGDDEDIQVPYLVIGSYRPEA